MKRKIAKVVIVAVLAAIQIHAGQHLFDTPKLSKGAYEGVIWEQGLYNTHDGVWRWDIYGISTNATKTKCALTFHRTNRVVTVTEVTYTQQEYKDSVLAHTGVVDDAERALILTNISEQVKNP